MKIPRTPVFLLPLVAALVFFLPGCQRQGQARKNSVVVYTSLDRPHSAPIFKLFEEQTGITVDAVYDTEAAKTVGLVNRLIAEKSNPRADVFWNSEIARSIVLKNKEVLAPYFSPSAADIPPAFKDPEGYWTGFAARGRVLMANTNLASETPGSIHDLANPQYKGKFTIANPLFGTTATHFSALHLLWGREKFEAFLVRLKENGVVISTGNATARDMVSAGEMPFCMTDTDDAHGAILNGRPVLMIDPDQNPDQEGLLVIPNTVCLVKGGPNPANGRKLIDFLLSRQVEEILASSPSAQIPLRKDVNHPPHVKTLPELKVIEVDFNQVAEKTEETASLVKKILLQ